MIKKYKLPKNVCEVYHDTSDDSLFVIITTLILDNREWQVVHKRQLLEENHD
jgi:hypothetical protein